MLIIFIHGAVFGFDKMLSIIGAGRSDTLRLLKIISNKISNAFASLFRVNSAALA